MMSRSSQHPPVYILPQHGVNSKAFKGKWQVKQSRMRLRKGTAYGEWRGHTAAKVCDMLRAGQAVNRWSARRLLVSSLTEWHLLLCLAAGSGFPGHGLPKFYLQLVHPTPQSSSSCHSRVPTEPPTVCTYFFQKVFRDQNEA